MELEILCKETIKPITSTSPELRNLPRCLFDQQAPNIYMQLLYFYTNNNAVVSSAGCRRRLLKDSLSKALTFYYPFAGRLRDGGNFIDCNDMGAIFSEAKLRCSMLEFMNNFNLEREEILKLTFAVDINGNDPTFNPLLLIQLTQFECGGDVMFVFCSHKIADLASLTNFMNDWASIARSSDDGDLPVVNPEINGVSYFPPELDAGGDPFGGGDGSGTVRRDENVCSKRLVFEGSKIAALKAMVSEEVENPTRVQILTAFIYKAVLSAKFSATGYNKKILTFVCGANLFYKGSRPATSLLQLINLRRRVEPPLPETLTGNIITFFIASWTAAEKREMELCNMVGDMKTSFEEFCKTFPRNYRDEAWSSLHKLHAKESMETWRNPGERSVYTCTSWCRFPMYEADFGWGKPEWITVPEAPWKNMILLMDAKNGDGIEAMVSLDKEEMAAFEQNQELLSFCELKTAAQMLSPSA
ncbi:vinorine synthase-like [Cucurbita moschata]|uniref:Vinorine synthase-like n=1 Tax=Cucurbita moschata TaxID=3662 RepID=A0A6J1F342_CUCMO|nr:vinorine synthase-like [Cucurbita moschata]